MASFWILVFFNGFSLSKPGGVSSHVVFLDMSVLAGRPCPLPVPPWVTLRTGHQVPHILHRVSGLSLSCHIQFLHCPCRHVT